MAQGIVKKEDLLPISASGGYAMVTYINKEPSK